jgi:ubiquinone biosynthesis protein
VLRLLRIISIVRIISRYRLDEFVPHSQLPFAIKCLLFLAPWHLLPKNKLNRGERIRLALEELGPIFIKFGQILSTRRDLLPDDIADELQHLQDNVPAFDGNEAKHRIEKALGKSINDLFARFDISPLASASIAQVHTAQLFNGREVVIKVIRPGIEKTIRQDISLMFMAANWVEKRWKDGRRLHPVEIVSDYEKTIFDELDLQREAANASQLRRNFDQSPLIYMPEIFWDYTNSHVLVMERIYGIPVADIPNLKAKGVNFKILAERGVEIFFTQVFRDSFFHADMHPGNIFVNADDPESPQYIAIDFGIVGTLSNEDQSYLARNLLAFFNRDYRQVAELHLSSGWVPEHTRVDEFESAIRTVCEPIFEKPLSQISFGQFLLKLFQTARRFDMEVQPQLVLLQKTLLNIEGLGRQLYPDLDLWNTAMPFLEKWMKQRVAPPGVWKQVKQHFPDWLEQSTELPQLLYDAMQQIRHLDVVPAPKSIHSVQSDAHHPKRSKKTLLFVSTFFFASAVWFASPSIQEWLTSLPKESFIMAALGILLYLKS